MDQVIADTLLELSSQTLAQGSLLRLRVRGTSMMPFLQPGDVVTARAVAVEALSCGDLAVVRSTEGLVIHRWLFCEHGLCWLRGDQLAEPDPPVGEQAVIATAVAVERNGRRRDFDSWRWRATNSLLGEVAWLLVRARSTAHRHANERHTLLVQRQSGFSLSRGAARISAAAYRVLVAALTWNSL